MSDQKNAGHASELGGLVAEIGGPKTDASGNLINSITGQVHTQKVVGTLPDNAAPSDLIDEAARLAHFGRIEVRKFDGSGVYVIHQGGEPVTMYHELESGRLAWVYGPRTSEPAPQQPAQPATPATGTVTFNGMGYPRSTPGNRAQSKTETHGLRGGMTAVYEFTVPMDATDGVGYLRFAGVAGSADNPVGIAAIVERGLVWSLSPAQAGNAPNFAYSVGAALDSQAEVRRGDHGGPCGTRLLKAEQVGEAESAQRKPARVEQVASRPAVAQL